MEYITVALEISIIGGRLLSDVVLANSFWVLAGTDYFRAETVAVDGCKDSFLIVDVGTGSFWLFGVEDGFC